MAIKLFDSELKVMGVLWEEGDTTAKQISDILKAEIGWNMNTTYTVIKKCIAKGAIERSEPNFLCHALITKQEAQEAETEMKEKKLRIEDALNATRAAVEEGIVAGGGTAYILGAKAASAVADSLEGDAKTGARAVAKALEAPVMQIAANAGLQGAVILDKIMASDVPTFGFDAAEEVFCDMIAAGIVDPTKVCRSALENAASVAGMVLTTESLVTDIKEPPAPVAPNPDMGGMY